jgi:cyanophycinase
MKRRKILLAGLSLLSAWSVAGVMKGSGSRLLAGSEPAEAMVQAEDRRPAGHLVIIGGAEDRTGDRVILRRMLALTGRQDPVVTVIAAASAFPDFVWGRYDRVFEELGVARRRHVPVGSRDDADNPELAALIEQSHLVLLTGGDQRRLLGLIGGTGLERALDHAYRVSGVCIAGTSAGAAAMSRNMLAGRSISDGLGLLRGALIDQHFSQRRRLDRLATAVARHPQLIGIGVDEDTALVISRGRKFEVIGSGAVTIVDGRRLGAPVEDVDMEALLQTSSMQIHQLPSGVSSAADHYRQKENMLQEEISALQALAEVLPVLTR